MRSNKKQPSPTTEQLAEKALQDIQQMSPEEKAEVRQHLDKELKPKPRRPRREYGIGDFLSYIHSDGGIANAARRVAHEEQLFLNFKPEGKPVN
jgi:hypothetical protein